MQHLDKLEAQSVYILREAYNRIEPLAMLWSLGKDSNVMVWLARKAFFGHVPFPVLHIDTGKKFKEMYEFRERYAVEWNLKLLKIITAETINGIMAQSEIFGVIILINIQMPKITELFGTHRMKLMGKVLG